MMGFWFGPIKISAPQNWVEGIFFQTPCSYLPRLRGNLIANFPQAMLLLIIIACKKRTVSDIFYCVQMPPTFHLILEKRMIKMSERSRFHFIFFLSFLFLNNSRMYFHFMFIGMPVMFRLRKATDQKIQKKKKKNKEKRRRREKRKRKRQKNRRKK